MKRFVLLLLLTVFLGSPMVHSRQPTPAEMEAISKETRLVFESFLQLWQEERYFEMYDYGKKQSREILSLGEFATRMVELDCQLGCLRKNLRKSPIVTAPCFI